MTSKRWLAALALVLGLALGAARCGREVNLGVDPASADGAASDAHPDAGDGG